MNRKARNPKSNQPTIRFNKMEQWWLRILWACQKSGLNAIADSIQKRINGVRHTDFVEIHIPLDCCVSISRACTNHEVGEGIAFITAASSHYVEKVKQKPVSSEALANAREALERMEVNESL